MLVEVLVDLDRRGVQTSLVREGGRTHIGLAWQVRLVGNVRDGIGDPGELLQLLVSHQRPPTFELKVSNEGCQIHVAGAFTVAIDRALDVHDPRLGCRNGVGDSAPRVVVTVHAQVDADLGGRGNNVTHPARQHAAVRVTQHRHLGAGLGGGAHHFESV